MSEGFVSASGRSPMTPRPPLAEQLDLLPHPEGGWFRETWRSPVSFSPEGYRGPRSAATAIYFLLHPGEQSRWHVVRSDELWFWHSGGPLDLLAMRPYWSAASWRLASTSPTSACTDAAAERAGSPRG